MRPRSMVHRLYIGSQGKSFFNNYIFKVGTNTATAFSDDKESDIAYAYEYQRVVFFDFANITPS